MKIHSIKTKVLALILTLAMIVPMLTQSLAFAVEGETSTTDYSQYIGAKVAEVLATETDSDGNGLFWMYDTPNGSSWTYTVLVSGYDADGNYYDNVNMAEAFDLIVGDVYADDAGALWFYFEIRKDIKDSADGEPYEFALDVWLKSDTVRLEETTGEESVEITLNGEPVSELTLPQYEKIVLKADSSVDGESRYQWQICYDTENDLWANIYGQNKSTLTLSYGVVASLLDENGAATVRCKSGNVISDPIKVTVAYESTATASAASSNPSQASSYASAAENQTYVVVINYLFADGRQAAAPWTATVAAGSSIIQTVNSPAVLGYVPDQATVSLNETNVSANINKTVIYNPAEVNYTVIHYQQNLNDDNYTRFETETKTGYTESAVGDDLAKTYEGFYSLLYDTTTKIAADGQTTIEIYYDRYYYLMTFDLDGGYGVEPIYARYGTPITVGTPVKPGYSFAGWNPEITYSTMPAQNTDYKATWTAGNTNYDVVFWYENADDTNYSQAGVLEDVGADSGSVVNGSIYANTNFTGRDADHFTYSHADENVTIEGDGSTVVNVYFSRNTYTLTFVAVGVCGLEVHDHTNCTLTCTLTEHTHSSDCCSRNHFHLSGCNTNNCEYDYEHSHSGTCYDCGKNTHTHTANCTNANRENTVKVVTAKYDSDISGVWETDPIKGYLDDGDVFQSSATGDYYSFLEKMPGQNLTLEQASFGGSSKYTWYYYLEVLPGQSTDGLTTRTDNGKTYYLYHTSSVTAGNLNLTYAEDYFPITGFTQRDQDVPDFSNRTAYLYYVRNSYTLTFSNNGDTVEGHGGSYLYEADISGTYFVPEYPENLEDGAYVFEGWYESPFFGDTKFEFTTTDADGNTVNATMPAKNVTLYARWVPKNHNVNIYLTSEMKAEDKIGETQIVPHRELATEPAQPNNGAYTFVGWFYMDGNTEKAFDFSMPVTKDLNLYAKWISNTLMEYTIHYQLVDGTPIAPDTVGSALAGTTKTFEAKAGDELNEGYKSGYFPTTHSHSLVIDIEDPTKNVYTFIYESKTKLNYKVMYLEYDGDYVYDGTETVLHTEKNAETTDAVITENFVPVTGYMPDAYQKRLVVSATESENVIIFWYVKDDVHAPVQIIHHVQNAVGDGYTIYQESTDLNGVIGQDYSTNILTINGYTYDHATANGVAITAADGVVVGQVTENGLILELYYDRNEYPYEFKFLEQGTDKELAESVTGTDRFGAQVIENAKVIEGYTLVSDSSQSMIIQIEDGTTAVKNVRIFYYTEKEVIINYVPVGPTGATNFGSVDPTSETVKVITGTANGSTPAVGENFKFVGWYEDVACTDPVDSEDGTVDANGKFIPAKVNGQYVAATYYAKFEYNLTSLTITKTIDAISDKDESFVFTVSGEGVNMTVVVKVPADQTIASVTISGLTVGDSVTVSETGFNSDYTTTTPSQTIVSLAPNGNSVSFENTKSSDKWLTESTHIPNLFKK